MLFRSTTMEHQTIRSNAVYNLTTNTMQTYAYNTRGYISAYVTMLNDDNYRYTYDGADRLTSDENIRMHMMR